MGEHPEFEAFKERVLQNPEARAAYDAAQARDAWAEWLGEMDEATNVFDYTDEATTVITIDVETLAERIATRLSVGAPMGEVEALPCCNYLELEDRRCDGVMDAGWPTYRCRSCGAFCGAQVHPTHASPTGHVAAADHENLQSNGLVEQKRDADGQHTGIHPERSGEAPQRADRAGIRGGPSVHDHAGPDPARGIAVRDSGGVAESVAQEGVSCATDHHLRLAAAGRYTPMRKQVEQDLARPPRWKIACINWGNRPAPRALVYMLIDGEIHAPRYFSTWTAAMTAVQVDLLAAHVVSIPVTGAGQ